MHTRKRHQDMFQDLNRKIHSADKERESPPVDAKAAKRWSVSSASSDKTNMSVKSSTLFVLPPIPTHLLYIMLFSLSLKVFSVQITTLEWSCLFNYNRNSFKYCIYLSAYRVCVRKITAEASRGIQLGLFGQ